MTRWASWIAMGLVLVAALTLGSVGDHAPRTEAERVQALAGEVRCPTCQNLSAAESDAKAAPAVRDAIRDGVRRGDTNAEIHAQLVGRFGDDIILKPKTSGVTGLVWVLPVLAGAVALAGLVFAFRRWKRDGTTAPTDADRALVEEALRS